MSKELEQFDPIAFLLAYNTGSISPEQTKSGFQHLINTGDAWRLERRYGQAAQDLIRRGVCSPSPTNTSQSEQFGDVGPYLNVSRHAMREVDGEAYRLVLYGAYNAMGLIGAECNGIAVFSERNKTVIADEIGIESTGYFGPSAAQLQIFDKLRKCPDEEFRAVVNTSPNIHFPLPEPKSTRPRGPRML